MATSGQVDTTINSHVFTAFTLHWHLVTAYYYQALLLQFLNRDLKFT